MKALTHYASRLLEPVYKKYNTVFAQILSHWPLIVGEDVASICVPKKMQGGGSSSHDGKRGSILVLECHPAHVLMISHQAPFLCDKVNAFFGYQAISSFKYLQSSEKWKVNSLPSQPASRSFACPEDLYEGLTESPLKSALEKLRLSL